MPEVYEIRSSSNFRSYIENGGSSRSSRHYRRFGASVIVAVVGGKATSGFPDKSIQKLLIVLVQTARRARPSTLARQVSRRVCWMARTRGRILFVSRESQRHDQTSEKLLCAITGIHIYRVYRSIQF